MKYINSILFLFCNSLFAPPGSCAVEHRNSSYFVANEGQWDRDFSFKLEAGNAIYFITPTGMTIDFREHEVSPLVQGGIKGGSLPNDPRPVKVRGHVVMMSFVNGNTSWEFRGEDKLAHYSNYFFSNNKSRWRSRVGHYEKIIVNDVWPGIDVEYVADPRGVETVYHVAPGGDASQIIVQYDGVDAPLSVDGSGNLILKTSIGEFKEKAPVAFQQRGRKVLVSFRLMENNKYCFDLGNYDLSKKLVIDPILYSTYFGAGYSISGITRVSETDILLLGETDSDEFPVTPGSYQETRTGLSDVFLARLGDNGRSHVFFTFVGGSHWDIPRALAVTTDGDIYFGGTTQSIDWPLLPISYDTTFGGATRAGMVAGLSSDGTELVYSSYLSSIANSHINDLTYDSTANEIYICGETGDDASFPLTPDALYSTSIGGGSFVVILDPSQPNIVYATFFPQLEALTNGFAAAWDIFTQGNRQIWISGSVNNGMLIPITDDAYKPYCEDGDSDGFLALLDLENNALIYSSYFGGSGDDYISVSPHPEMENTVIINGITHSTDFPVTPTAFDTTLDLDSFGVGVNGFVTILQLPSTILYSTFIGGVTGCNVRIADYVEGKGIVIAGTVGGSDVPVTEDADDSTFNGGLDLFFAQLSPHLDSLIFATFWGSPNNELIVTKGFFDVNQSLWIGGVTLFCDFPTTPDALYPVCSGIYNNYFCNIQFSDLMDSAPVFRAKMSNFQLDVYPNPFNSSTQIQLTIPTPGPVTINIYDILGRSLLNEHLGNRAQGTINYYLNATSWPSGYYILQATTPFQSYNKKLTLIR